MNDLPVRRSSRGVPPEVFPEDFPRFSPASIRSPLAALHILDAHMHPVPAPAAHADPAYRWASAACAPAAHRLLVPCTLATALPDMCAASRSVPLLPSLCVPVSYALPFLPPPSTQPQPHKPQDA